MPAYNISWYKIPGFLPRLAASFSFAFKRRDGVVLIRCKLNDHGMSNRPRSTHDVNQDYLVGIPKAFRFLWVMGMGKMATPQNSAQHHQCLSEVSTDPEIMHLRKEKSHEGYNVCLYIEEKQQVKHILTYQLDYTIMTARTPVST